MILSNIKKKKKRDEKQFFGKYNYLKETYLYFSAEAILKDKPMYFVMFYTIVMLKNLYNLFEKITKTKAIEDYNEYYFSRKTKISSITKSFLFLLIFFFGFKCKLSHSKCRKCSQNQLFLNEKEKQRCYF